MTPRAEAPAATSARRRAVIVEDETIARETLHAMLDEVPWLSVVGVAASGPDALAVIERERPELVFLDIELPGLSGLDVVRHLSAPPLVVFTTAYNEHAVAAFELAALDYLLKPFGRDRLDTALNRARRVLDEGAPAMTQERVAQALDAPARAEPLTRFFVRDRGKLVLLWTHEVERLEADDDYVHVVVKGRAHLVYLTLNDFERRLDPLKFVRIHRTHMVNLDFVSHLNPVDGGRIEVLMRDGTRLTASRTRSRELRELTL
ncbi:MAG: LytR/AlgR family response regulator transcription factor [Gemmatimonadaceae bacterium]